MAEITKDPTRKAAGQEARVFSKKDLLIPQLKDIRAQITLKEITLKELKTLRDEGPKHQGSYEYKREQIMKEIDFWNDELDGLNARWENIDRKIIDFGKMIETLKSKEKLSKSRKQVEAFLKMKAKMAEIEVKLDK